MGSLHLYLPFSMEYRARAPSIRFRLLPTLRTFHLLVPPISMLQQHLPQHLSHQLPPLLRQLARDLIKTRFRMLFPPIPHRLKHLLRTSHKLRLRLFPIHLASPSLFSFLLPQVYLPSPSQKIWDAPSCIHLVNVSNIRCASQKYYRELLDVRQTAASLLGSVMPPCW